MASSIFKSKFSAIKKKITINAFPPQSLIKQNPRTTPIKLIFKLRTARQAREKNMSGIT